MNKKADAVTAIIIVIIIVIFLGWLITVSNRECKSNNDCGRDYYCGSDFSCHEYPTIERTITKVDYARPALIIGIAILLVFLFPKLLTFIKETWAEKRERKEEKELTEEKAEDKKEKSEKEEFERTYYNYPVSHKYTIKTGRKEKIKKEEKGYSAETVEEKGFFYNNYIGMILGGLTAIGIVLATNIDYILASLLGGVLLFILVYKLWSYCIEYDAEIYLIAILSLIYFTFSLIYFAKGGIFILIGLSYWAVILFIIKETVSWISYKNL